MLVCILETVACRSFAFVNADLNFFRTDDNVPFFLSRSTDGLGIVEGINARGEIGEKT